MIRALQISAVCLTGASAYYFYRLNRAISNVKAASITVVDHNPDSFLESRAHRSVANPRNYFALRDTRSVTIVLPPSKANWSDEQILANFVKGFFGGWVFTPERLVFQAARPDLVRFSGKMTPHELEREILTHFPSIVIPKPEEQNRIWSTQSLLEDRLPPLTSTLFGAFQVIDKRISSSAESCVDIGFGSDESSFAGVHRFSVQRFLSDEKSSSSAAAAAAAREVKITHSSFACNPIKNKPRKLQFLFTFHKLYAMLLFREGVAQILDMSTSMAPTT